MIENFEFMNKDDKDAMFPKSIENLLYDRKITKSELARHINTSRTTLDDYLNSATQMPADKIQKTAAFFGVSVGYLFGECLQESEEMKSLKELIFEQQKQLNGIEKQLEKLNKTTTKPSKNKQIKSK